MTLVQLVSSIAKSTGLSKKEVFAVLSHYQNEVKKVAITGESLKSSGFGTFYVVKLKSRKIPKGGMSEPRNIIRFRQSKTKGE